MDEESDEDMFITQSVTKRKHENVWLSDADFPVEPLPAMFDLDVGNLSELQTFSDSDGKDIDLFLNSCEANVDEVKPREKQVTRPVVVVDDDEVRERQLSRIPANTKKATKWSLGVWTDWKVARSETCSEDSDKCPAGVGDITKMSKEELDFWLSKFVLEVRKTNGECFYPNTLYGICCGLQRYLRDNGRPEINLWTDYNFKGFQDSLDGEMKRLTSQGVGVIKKQAEAFSREEENLLWEKKLLGDSDAYTLLNTLVFLIGKFFSLRGGKEHRALCIGQMDIQEAVGDKAGKIRYTSYSEKNYQGGIKHRRLQPKVVEHFSNSVNPERCLVRLMKLYMSKW